MTPGQNVFLPFFTVGDSLHEPIGKFHRLHRVNVCPKNDINPLMPNGAFNICCPRDCVSRHNGGTSGAPLKHLRVDSALRALSTLRGLRGAPEVPPLCRETQSLGQQMLYAPFGINGLTRIADMSKDFQIILHQTEFSLIQN